MSVPLKLDALPVLSGPLTQATVVQWLDKCADTFETIILMNPSCEPLLNARLKISMAGLRIKEISAELWYMENRDALKALATWDLFAERVRDRFIPTGWKLNALERFFDVSQGFRGFLAFANDLQAVVEATLWTIIFRF